MEGFERALLLAWAAAADPDFGGSLDPLFDTEPPAERRVPHNTGRKPKTGVRHVSLHANGYYARPPNAKWRLFRDLESARAYVALFTEGI